MVFIKNLIYNNYISNMSKKIFRNFFNYKITTPLGRWKLKDSDKNINLTIDYSNEDHCGTCAQYINDKHKEKDNYNLTNEEYLAQFELLNVNAPNTNINKNNKMTNK